MSNRNTRRTSKNRRTPQKASGGAQFPWVPAGIVAGVVAVIVVIIVVVLQAGGSSDDKAAAVAAEADDSTTWPGTWVDLPSIYGGPYPDTGGHVSVAVDYEADGNSNPPAGGPHWSGACGEDPNSAPPFCGPAPIGIYRDPWPAETLVHNMEHGGVVVWYNFDDTALRDELEAVVEAHLEDNEPVTMAPYHDMEDNTIAITSWSRIEKFPVSEYTKERVDTFINAHQRRFNPEHF
jgi:hypothetical protein